MTFLLFWKKHNCSAKFLMPWIHCRKVFPDVAYFEKFFYQRFNWSIHVVGANTSQQVFGIQWWDESNWIRQTVNTVPRFRWPFIYRTGPVGFWSTFLGNMTCVVCRISLFWTLFFLKKAILESVLLLAVFHLHIQMLTKTRIVAGQTVSLVLKPRSSTSCTTCWKLL